MFCNHHPVRNNPSLVELNMFSITNTDMDYSFFVPADQEEEAAAALLANDRAWWEDEGDGEWWGIPHPECLEMALMDKGIPYAIRYNGEEGREED